MIDAASLPNALNEQRFFGVSSQASAFFQRIETPKQANFVWFTAIGPGGGGGRPTAGAGTTGAGGGGSGAVTHAVFMARDLPKTLYALVYTGGLGATANGTNGGGAGLSTWVTTNNSLATQDALVYAIGGGGGTAAGGGGIAGTASGIGSMRLASLALWLNATAGQAGAGGTISAGNSVQICVSNFCSAGAGGGGSASDNNGGGQTSSSVLYPSIPASVVGQSGFIVQRPFICIGGAGGGGTTGATGNPGGNGGGYGSGGGGGGNGVTTSGNGGDGGAGLVIMRWW